MLFLLLSLFHPLASYFCHNFLEKKGRKKHFGSLWLTFDNFDQLFLTLIFLIFKPNGYTRWYSLAEGA